MPKLILRCNYLKNAPPSHLANYMNYISTREGVEKIDNTCGLLPATVKQKEMIADILSKIEDADHMHEYYDYLQRPTRENATEFITQALENNLDIIAKKKNYIDYLANRPRVERIGTHGLFSNEGESIVLSRVAEEVANHPGVIWTNVISLRREDAERLGYDSAAQWQALLRSRVELLCENYKIDSRNLKWYAAFHNESHHPHVHLVVYSTNPSEGYLSSKGIDNMRSTYAHDIFRQEFMSIYEKRTQQREQLKEQANKSLLFLLQQMQSGICHNEKIAEQIQLLSKRLRNTGGKKVYGYLKAGVKAIVNGIVDELAKEEKVAECYKQWLESKSEILHFYKDADAEQLLLSEQKELKSIKNMVIREAVRYGEGYLYTEDEGLEDLETEREEMDTDDSRVSEDTVEAPADDFSDEPETEEPDGQQFYAKWTDAYKEAREYLYGTPQMEPDEEAAYEIMKEEAEQGNAYAMADMGKMYAQGIFVEADQTKAQEWYEKSLKAMLIVEGREENTYLEYRIGKMYQYGLGTEENMTEAAKWFGMPSSKEHKYALYSLGMLYLHGKGVEQDEEKACQLFQRSHKKGNPYASFELGKLYEVGRGTGRNTDLAEKCYRVAFLGFLNLEKKSRDDTLWYRIGTMYQKGIGTEADEKEAEKYLRKSADYGNTHAAYQLAKMYIRQETEKLKMNPEEIPDYEKIKQALKWLIAASEQGNSFADYALGKLYADGELTAKDMEKAFHHLHKAADTDNAFACYRLGRLYLADEYKDIGRAVRYLTLAANLKNEFASYRLGKLYLAGEGMEKNSELAIRYLEESDDAGNQYAQYVLGKVYLMGKEVEQDREKAYKYFRLAAEQGNVYAAYFLEHWNDMPHPDLLLMATRLMHHLEKIIEDDVSGKKGGRRSGMDRKLARKIKSKKIAQGHARDDRSFRMNEDGSDSSYGFGYAGAGNKLYVFEAPMDFLSFLTLYPKNWQENSYIVLNGVSEHAMLQMLKDYPHLDTVVLCLDHDPAGIEACGRLAEILVQNGYRQIKNLQSSCKGWNEDLKLLHGEEVIPAQEHPKILECDAWMEILKQVTDSVDTKYATKENVCRYYQDIYNALKKGNGKEHLEDAFDGGGMLLTGVLVRCMEKTGRELGRETSADEILDNLHKRYRPHRDKENYNTRLRNMQKAFEEVMEVFDKKDLSLKENKEEFVKKCMSLTMECIKAHILLQQNMRNPYKGRR